MTFLAPWAIVLGAAGALGVVLLHLVATQRPAAYLLPTARFVPDRQSLVSRAVSRPRDLLLLLVRVLLLLCAGAAFARPVLDTNRTTRARIVLLDRSAHVADPADAWRRARTLAGASSILIAFDSSTSTIGVKSSDSLPSPTMTPGSITAALVAARRAAPALALHADSVELLLVSPVAAAEVDAATPAVRATWPGAIRLERVAMRTDSVPAPALEHPVPIAGVLGPALVRAAVAASPHAIRIRRHGSADASDSVFAHTGGTVVAWDSMSGPLTARGLAVGDDVLVAALGARPVPVAGIVVARWADGRPAAVESAMGAGCIRTIGIVVPSVGDLALRPAFERIARGLTAPCARVTSSAADTATLRQLSGGGGTAPGSAFDDGSRPPSRLVPWLLGAALLLAAVELGLRRRMHASEGVA